MRVVIVSFAPANDSVGVGGFNWFRLYDPAIENYWDECKESEIAGGSHIVRLLVSPELDISLSDDEITQWIDNDLDRWEFSETPVMQYIPPTTAPDRLPKKREELTTMVNLAPDGTLSISADNFGLNWNDDTPEHIEIEEISADEPDEWIRGYVRVDTLRELLKKIDERN